MRTVYINSFQQLLKGLEKFREDAPMAFFRGQSDARWPLIPKVGRAEYKHIEDDFLFADWKSAVRSHECVEARTELELLALAQHHGLATRLLDWTSSPMIAAFFAVWEPRKCDAAVFAYQSCEFLPSDSDVDPFERDSESTVTGWKPHPFTPRIRQQRGLFTIHSPPTTPHYALRRLERLVRFVIHRSYRDQLRDELAFFGFTRETLFPDLDGAAAHLNWNIHRFFPRRDKNTDSRASKKRGLK